MKSVGLLFLVAVLLASCNETIIKNKLTIPPARPELVQKISYTEIYSRVFLPKCVTCHGSSGGLSLETYANARANLEGIAKTVLVQQTMPKSPVSPLTEEEKELVAAWYEAGGPEYPLNGGTPPPLPLPKLEPKFESLKALIFIPKCTSCHGPGGNAARIPLNTTEDFLDSPLEIVLPGNPEESGLMLVIQPDARKRMPPRESGMAALPESEIEAIRVWIQNGAKD